MTLTVVDILSHEQLLAIDSPDGLLPTPNIQDTLVLPNKQQVVVMAKAFVCHAQSNIMMPGKPTPMPGSNPLAIEIQCAVAPADKLPEYLEKLNGGNGNAGT